MNSSNSTLKFSAVPSGSTITKTLELVYDRYKWADKKTLQDCYILMQSKKSSEDLVGGWWHRACFKHYGSIDHHTRAQKRFEKAQEQFEKAQLSSKLHSKNNIISESLI